MSNNGIFLHKDCHIKSELYVNRVVTTIEVVEVMADKEEADNGETRVSGEVKDNGAIIISGVTKATGTSRQAMG